MNMMERKRPSKSGERAVKSELRFIAKILVKLHNNFLSGSLFSFAAH